MNKSVFEEPFKLLIPLLSFVPFIAFGVPLMGLADTLLVFRWFIILLLFALIAYPISVTLFHGHRTGGFFLSTIVGILSTSIIVWTLSYMKIPMFSFVGICIVMLGIGGFAYGYKPLRENAIKKLSETNIMYEIAFEETIFAFVLTILCFYKGMYPDINGQEKFMNYGFIMSMLRSSTLPANDMWLSGYSINYYYYGQFIYTLLIKFSGVPTGVGYTVSMCSAIAIPFAMSYSIGTYLIDTAKNVGLRTARFFPHIAGILAGLCVTIFGNSHSFYYDPDGLGNNFLKFLQKKGYNVGQIDNFFYPDSTRFIGYNPDSSTIPGIKNGGDYTIEEFPFYSYLVGDLHAHVVSTMVVLLIMAICVAAINRISSEPYGEPQLNVKLPLIRLRGEASNNYIKSEIKRLVSIEIIAAAVLLGIAQMTNYWDFLIYFIFCSMTLLVLMTHKSNDFSTIPGFIAFGGIMACILGCYLVAGSYPLIHVLLQLFIFCVALVFCLMFPCALSRTSCGMSFLFTVAHIVALTFNMNFDMISNKLGKSVNHTAPFQLWILWGTHVGVNLVFILFTIIYKNYRHASSSKKKNVKANAKGAVYGANSYPNPIAKFFGERNIVDIFVCGMIVVGILLLIAPEIFYVRDIYTGGYLRSNTMFKFTYAGFIILSMAMSYSIIRLFWLVNSQGKYSVASFVVSVIFIFMLFIPAHYTIAALSQRCGTLSKDNYKQLDGTSYLTTYTSPTLPEDMKYSGNMVPYAQAVNWFNTNVSGQPVIMESFGESYTDYDFISAYTGLPTVCGWQTHEWLWRFHGIVDEETDLLISDPDYDVWSIYLTPRHTDIRTVYTTENTAEIQEIIDRYNVEYIVIGPLERSRFSYDNTERISSLGEVVYSADGVTIVRTTPAGVPA